MGHRIAIIGGGLAGTACAYVLKNDGYDPVIFEASDQLAAGASGNPVGLYNPRFFAEKTPEADFYIEAYLSVSKLFASFGMTIDHSPHGSMHLITTDDKYKRFAKMVENWGLPEAEMRIVPKEDATDITGIPLGYDGLFLPNSGTVNPPKLCALYSKDIDVRLNTSIEDISCNDHWDINGEAFDSVILACGAGVKKFTQTQWLPIHTVRGQIAGFAENDVSKKLKTNVNYGGYISPAQNGVHTCGSTFQKWLHHTDPLSEDNEYIADKLTDAVPSLSGIGEVIYERASMRTASQDRLPIIGQVANRHMERGEIFYIPNCYVSTAHGSHGIVTSYMAAQLILQHIKGEAGAHYASHFAPERFLKRLLRKNS